ncbi:hypothetical protein BDZ94DRAFT_1312456 [Collybia nuda]|uniref:Uncharacterized protein n=1 Tax=Collybia nuda TaxID=64659 RepID=A0A9P5Y105_9AGAR|nr:hypothetical protein BDZ94DRAFT_1312456 [Collybia nuda]
MASSSSQPGQRRKPLKKRQPLARTNSSLLGTIKNLVTAPLAWFANTDEFEDTKDLKGKRRRLVTAQADSTGEEDNRSSRNKRLRVHSPPRDHQPAPQLPFGRSYGYLDPPGAAFPQDYQSNIFNQSNSTRSTSAFTPASTYESFPNFNPVRASNISRTMSIDPPSRPTSRSSTFASIPMPINRDNSVDSSMKALSLRRDLSMPPLSGRPSFRLRTSMTPVPQTHREVSEPPSINTLVSNPMFIRGPPQIESHHSGLSRKASVTLGSLVESVRSTRSPSRQHSSLLFGSGPDPSSYNVAHQENPAEKALHELEIYRTPLVPTRLRSSNPLSGPGPSVDLFKPRRGTHLVLMQDNTRMNRLGRKVSGKKEAHLVNETKPYAGEGGMKKLLARRKMEVEDVEEVKEDKLVNAKPLVQHNGDGMEDGEKESNSTSEHIPLPLPPLAKSDWLLTASGLSTLPASTTSSSLRVGRNKRAHIARPTTRPMKTKFSAAYEDDDPMDDEGDQEDERRKERAMLDEAAKRAPLFEIPQGFTFAKVAEPIQHGTIDAKEPPIASLPFSFSKPTPAPPTQGPSPASEDALNVTVSQLAPVPPEPMTSSVSTNGNGVPNFFATSSVFTKPLDVPQPPPFTLTVSQPEPVKDSENPLWEGENDNKKLDTPIPSSGLFSEFGVVKNGVADSNIQSLSAPLPALSLNPEPTPTTSIPSFFGSNTKDDTHSVSRESSIIPVDQGHSFPQPPTIPSSISSTTPKPVPLFDSGPMNPATSSEISKPVITFNSDAPRVAAPPISFSLSQPVEPTTSAVETPKSLFGGPVSAGPIEAPKSNFGGGFSFGIKGKESKPANMPFSFGAPNTPPVEPKKDQPFSFGPLPAIPTPLVAPATMAFSFSNTSSANDTGNKPFSFGTPAVIPPTDRPSTPPKNQDQECSMEESPTRDIQPVHESNKPPDRPTAGFSFGSNTSGSIFGNQPVGSASMTSSSPFSFSTTSSSNPFAKGDKTDDNKPFGGFRQTLAPASSAPGFTFGQNKPADNGDSARSSTPGSFGFNGSTPLSTTGPGPAFAFGGSANNSASTLFGQVTQAPSSTPSSPSTFNQPSPFSFSAPLPPVNASFTFGSQPASPAGGNSTLSLPQSTTPGTFGVSGFGQAQPSSPFGVPTSVAPAPSSGGGTLFTIGAPPSAPAGARAIRKLPNRRGGTKR